MIFKKIWWIGIILIVALSVLAEEDSLRPLNDGKILENFEALWAGYDPTKEPLETEILKQWEQDDVILRVVRYRIGVFKGKKAMMAAIYGFPKEGKNLPGLVQIHGGGQYADYRAVLTNAKRGYATISLAWAGRINAPGYLVDHKGVKLFWDDATNNPDYKLTSDWGALDAYHDPCRNLDNSFFQIAPASWTLDSVDSPRNCPWFLCTLAARRALTFLQQQPEVNPEKLGVYGHSMGGTLTVMTAAADSRVKAAAPSSGGLSVRNHPIPLFRATLDDDVSLKNITCPIIFLMPADDFNARVDDLQKALGEIRSMDWRVTCGPNHNHQDTPEYMVDGLLWFDQQLKRTFSFPRTPDASLNLKTSDSTPSFTVEPDIAKPILSVDIYYTQQGQMDGEKDDTDNTKNRFWKHAETRKMGSAWIAQLPLESTKKPLWVYANVLYPLDSPVTAADYYYSIYTATQFNLSSRMIIATPDRLKESGIRVTEKPSLMIETFGKDWQKNWFTYDLTSWGRRTHKIYDDLWKAPTEAKLALDIRSAQPNKLVVGLDDYAAEVRLTGGHEWQSIILVPADFHNVEGSSMLNWKAIKELRLEPSDMLNSNNAGKEKSLGLGANWQGPNPEFRDLRWVENPK
jgi:hypothetical protein